MKKSQWLMAAMLAAALLCGIAISIALFRAADSAGEVTAMAMMASNTQP